VVDAGDRGPRPSYDGAELYGLFVVIELARAVDVRNGYDLEDATTLT
jgi:hypothetical protein